MVAYVNHKNEYANEGATSRGCVGLVEGRKNLKKIFLCTV